MTDKPATKFSFKKSARLSSKKDIEELFTNSSSFFLYPFKILYLEDKQGRLTSNQILITVPKRHHKNAVNRNKIKRLIREAYRLNQYILSDGTDKKFFIAYIYISEDLLHYKEVEIKLKKALQRLRNIAGNKDDKSSVNRNRDKS